jgi:hypothetical protein
MKKTKVTVACCALITPLAFCASALAGPSGNVVQPATQQSAQKKEGMLRSEENLRYPAALRSTRRDSDYR